MTKNVFKDNSQPVRLIGGQTEPNGKQFNNYQMFSNSIRILQPKKKSENFSQKISQYPVIQKPSNLLKCIKQAVLSSRYYLLGRIQVEATLLLASLLNLLFFCKTIVSHPKEKKQFR